MVEKKESSTSISPIEIVWGPVVGKSPLAQQAYPLLTPLENVESDSAPMTSAPPPIKKIPLQPLPAAAQPAANLDLPIKKMSFLFWALGLMILGICFFLAGFFFSLWVNKKPAEPALSPPALVKSVSSGGKGGSSETSQKLLAGALAALPAALSKNGSGYAEIAPVLSEILKQSLGKGEAGAAAISSTSSQEALATPSGVRYGVQLGTFVTKENAADLAKKLEDRKIPAHIKTEVDDTGEELFCVRTRDEFSSYDAAEAAAHSLFQQESISAFVVPIVNLKHKKSKDA